MAAKKYSPKLTPIASAMHAVVVGTTVVSGESVTVRSAQAGDEPGIESTKRGYRIPAGPLGPALSRFATAAGARLSFDPVLTEGKTTRGLSGDFTREEGLASLLAGTGLEWAPGPGGTYTVRPTSRAQATPEAPAPTGEQPVELDTITLDPITVTAQPLDQGFKADTQETATKMPLSIRETPQSVSVITRDSFDERQVLTLGQALELSAGVTQYSGNGPFAGQPSFGFNQTTIRGIGIDSLYDFREDGFINGSFFSITDLAIYDRIEIVKGPSSVLYGRGSVGGLVNRVRKKPLAQSRQELELSVGSFDTYRADVDITGPLFASEPVRGRLVAAYEDSGSFVDGPETQRTVLAPSLDLDLSPSTRLLLMGLYQSEEIIPNTGTPLRRDGTGGGFVAPNTSRSRYIGNVTREPYTWQIGSATAQLEQDLGDRWLATLRLNYSNIDTPIRVDAYAYAYDGLASGVGADTAIGELSVGGNDFRIHRDIWSGELLLSGSVDLFGREARLAFGVDQNENQYSRVGAYTDFLSANIYDAEFPLPDRATLTPGFATEGEPLSRGAFAQAQIRPTERLAVLLGLRYDKVDLRTTPFHPATVEAERQDKKVDDITGRIGLTYDLSEQISVYTLYAQSFQPVLFANDVEGNLLDPETGEIYEIGAKTEWFGGKLGLNAAIYRIDRDKIPVSVPDDPTDNIPPFSVSSGLQRSDGFEIEINGRLLPGWDLSLAYNQVDSEFKDPRDPLFGFQPGGTADWQLGLFSSYELQSGPFKGLGLGATLYAIDDRGVGFVPGTIPGYERLDLHLFYKSFESTDINLVVRNVTDERYIEGADRPGGYAQFGSPTAVLLTVRYDFGD